LRRQTASQLTCGINQTTPAPPPCKRCHQPATYQARTRSFLLALVQEEEWCAAVSSLFLLPRPTSLATNTPDHLSAHRLYLASVLAECDEAAAPAEGEHNAITTLNVPHHTHLQNSYTRKVLQGGHAATLQSTLGKRDCSQNARTIAATGAPLCCAVCPNTRTLLVHDAYQGLLDSCTGRHHLPTTKSVLATMKKKGVTGRTHSYAATNPWKEGVQPE
jgi:hypothetical protein